ncbi:MAG: flagellar biosynthetic protein FliO [Lachnospiraceae bacterium]|nr:flagellar biosynthetic protein FliO [Lachnospiraceae bacterium]
MLIYLRVAAGMLLSFKGTTTESAAPGNAVNNLARFLSLLVIFILVLALAYYTTRLVAKSQRGLGHAGNMQILESMALGGGKTLLLVRAGKHYLVLATGKDSVSTVAELAEDEILPVTEGSSPGGFGEILRRVKSLQAAEPDKGTDEHEEKNDQ